MDHDSVKKMRVLIADDDPVFLAIAAEYLASDCYDIVNVADGAAAWGALLDEQFDLAAIDLSMPHIDGFRLIALIRSTPRLRDMPIIVVTSNSDPSAMKEADRLGVNSFITKPIDWPLLQQDIYRLLEASARKSTALSGRVPAEPKPSGQCAISALSHRPRQIQRWNSG